MRLTIFYRNSGEHCGQEDQLALWRSTTRAGMVYFRSIQIQINSNSNSNRQGKWPEPEVPTKWPGKKLTVIDVERVRYPAGLPHLHKLRAWYPAGVGPACSRLLCYYMPSFLFVSVCRGCVASPKACCLSLPPSNELPPFELLIAAGHSLSVPFNLGAISLLNRCEVMISSGEQG